MVLTAVGWALLSGALVASSASPATSVAVASAVQSAMAVAPPVVVQPSRLVHPATGIASIFAQAEVLGTQSDPDTMPGNVLDAPLALVSHSVSEQSPLTPLLARLAPMIDRFPALAGVAVVDLQTGDRGGLNQHRQFQAASTV